MDFDPIGRLIYGSTFRNMGHSSWFDSWYDEMVRCKMGPFDRTTLISLSNAYWLLGNPWL